MSNSVEGAFFESAFEGSRLSGAGDMLESILLCGSASANGYRFAPGAFGNAESVRSRYEGTAVYLDHDLERGLGRQVRDLAGVVKNARLEGGVPRGDVMLTKTSAGKELKELFEFSQRSGLKGLGMSHCAEYRFSATDKKLVEDVTKVHSCDVVCRPATTKTFKEHTEKMTEEELKAEVERLTLELDKYKAREAIAARKASIREELEAEGFGVNDKVAVSVVFFESLIREGSAEKRKEMIRDRKGLLSSAHSGNPTSRERKVTSDEFDVEKALSKATFSY